MDLKGIVLTASSVVVLVAVGMNYREYRAARNWLIKRPQRDLPDASHWNNYSQARRKRFLGNICYGVGVMGRSFAVWNYYMNIWGR